jgi:hypothetical protein
MLEHKTVIPEPMVRPVCSGAINNNRLITALGAAAWIRQLADLASPSICHSASASYLSEQSAAQATWCTVQLHGVGYRSSPDAHIHSRRSNMMLRSILLTVYNADRPWGGIPVPNIYPLIPVPPSNTTVPEPHFATASRDLARVDEAVS